MNLAARRLPGALRSFVRGRESGLVLAAAIIGALSGVLVTGIAAVVQLCHVVLFGIDPTSRLSGVIALDHWRASLVPVLGGALLAGLTFAAKRLTGRLADAIEANALYGGRLSIRGSLVVTLQTIASCGFGASVGLEAGYAQICSMVGSRLGLALAARRADMRLLVACGAAGAIAGAFNAPLAGAFYAFEVVLGTYTVGALAPVAISALVATQITQRWSHETFLIRPGSLEAIGPLDLAHVAAIGACCGLVGILLMRTVGLCEASFGRLRIPPLLRPVLGGALVGDAAATPAAGEGHEREEGEEDGGEETGHGEGRGP